MRKYITKHGRILTEEQLEEAYRRNTFTTFNERAYTEWKFAHLLNGSLQYVD